MPRSRTWGLVDRRHLLALSVFAALLMILPGGVHSVSPGPSVAVGPLPSHLRSVSAGAQLAAARASLPLGVGPFVPSGVPLLSPGGYSWSNVTGVVGPAPSGRISSLAWDDSDGYVLLFGWDTLAGYQTDTWTYLNGVWTNISATVTGAPPSPQAYPVMASDPSTQKLVMFSPVHNTTWTYHAKVWTNVTATAGPHPPPALYASLVADSTDGELVYFGGMPAYGNTQYAHTTWTYKNGQWANVTVLAPFAFGRIVIPQGADDPMDHGVIAVGISAWHNVTPFRYFPATFLYSGGHWTNLTSSLTQEPRMPYLGVFAYIPQLSAAVLTQSYGVNTSGNLSTLATTWEYSHSQWTNVTALTNGQPDTGLIAGGAVDPLDGTLVLFGGDRQVNPVVYPATWLFSAAPNLTATASRSLVDAGQSVTFGGTVAGGASPLTFHWAYGDGGSSTGLSSTHSYSQAGLVTATLSATDLVGHVSTASISLYVNPTLAVTLNATPSSPSSGAWVALTSHVVGGSAPFTFAWSLGDNSSSTAASLGHIYGSSGTYKVHLVVTDAAGASVSANLSVVVQAAAQSFSLTSGTGLALIGVIVVLLLVAVALAVLLMRKPRGPGPMPSYPTSPPAAPIPPSPPTQVAPPPPPT